MHDENVHALQVYLHQILMDPSVDLERRGSQPSHRLQKFKIFRDQRVVLMKPATTILAAMQGPGQSCYIIPWLDARFDRDF